MTTQMMYRRKMNRPSPSQPTARRPRNRRESSRKTFRLPDAAFSTSRSVSSFGCGTQPVSGHVVNEPPFAARSPFGSSAAFEGSVAGVNLPPSELPAVGFFALVSVGLFALALRLAASSSFPSSVADFFADGRVSTFIGVPYLAHRARARLSAFRLALRLRVESGSVPGAVAANAASSGSSDGSRVGSGSAGESGAGGASCGARGRFPVAAFGSGVTAGRRRRRLARGATARRGRDCLSR